MKEFRAVIDRGIFTPTKYIRINDFERDSKGGMVKLVKTSGEEVYYPSKKVSRIEEV